jgi:hypothetical protein
VAAEPYGPMRRSAFSFPDLTRVEWPGKHRPGLVVKHAQLDLPAEQSARSVDLVAPELDPFRVVVGELRMRAGLGDRHADDQRGLLREGTRQAR